MTAIGAIPEHWDLSEIKKLISLETGKRMKGGADVNGEVISVGGEHISEEGLLNLAKPKYISLDFYNELRQGKIHANDVLLVKDGATTGKLAYISKMPKDKMAINEHVFIIRGSISALLDNQFLYYALKSSNGQKQIRFRYHGLIGGVTRGDIESIILPIPPIHEQRTISHVLRTIQNAREARLWEVALEKERKAALMEHLFTHGTRGEATKQTELGEMPESWKVVKLGEVFEVQLGKMLSSKARAGISPRPYLRNANVQWGKIDLSDLYQMDFSDAEARKFELKYGDVLVCEGGEIGRTAIWHNEVEGCYYQKALYRLRPKNNLIVPEYFLYYFMVAFIIRNTYGVSGTKTTIAHLPAIKLKMLQIPIPNIEEQKEISAVLGVCDSKIIALEHEARLLEELFHAMLEELMSGRLPVGALVEEAA